MFETAQLINSNKKVKALNVFSETQLQEINI